MRTYIKSGVLLFFLCITPLFADDLTTLFDTANNLYAQNKIEESIHAYEQLLQYYPTCLTAHYNLGVILRRAGFIQEAIPKLKLVTQADPSFAKAHISLGQAYLATGNYLDGWQELEWRLGTPPESVQKLKNYLKKHGNLNNKTVLIRAEWGLGDTLQMIRYAQELKHLGATVVALPQKPLMNLLSTCSYLDHILAPHDSLRPFHFEIPIMSLPVVFETTIETIPTDIPYLLIDQQLIAAWGNILGPHNKLRIGICWQGNHIHASTKFMPLKKFMKLAAIEGVQLYSLQQQLGLEQLEGISQQKLIRFNQDFDKTNGSFMDTAAVMHHLDVIITVDTSIAHLAGALGIPTWLILPQFADWRWMLERNDCPWYSTMRLFRQKKDGVWHDVIQNIKQCLQEIINKQGITNCD